MRLVLAALVFSLAAGALAWGRSDTPDPLMGHWELMTGRFNGECRMSGVLTVTRQIGPDRFACTLVANETCPDIKIRADQTCVIERTAEGVQITATVVRLTPEVSYAPDDFALEETEPGRLMRGELVSASIAQAEFRRPQAVPTS